MSSKRLPHVADICKYGVNGVFRGLGDSGVYCFLKFSSDAGGVGNKSNQGSEPALSNSRSISVICRNDMLNVMPLCHRLSL